MDADSLAERFEAERARLHDVAYRLLGSASEADDAVQDAWLRLSRADASAIENLSGWLTTVVARLCLDTLRARRSRREEPLGPAATAGPAADGADAERELVVAESVGLAMMAVLERLAPAERVAFVLHDVFGVPYAEIAGIVGRSPVAARQLASRGRRRVRGASDAGRTADVPQHRDAVEAFFHATRTGDLGALLAVLDPDVTLRLDETALRMSTRSGWLGSELEGADAVAAQFAGRAQAAQLALIDGVPGMIWATGGKPRVVFGFTVRGGRVAGIELVADAERLGRMKIEVLA